MKDGIRIKLGTQLGIKTGLMMADMNVLVTYDDSVIENISRSVDTLSQINQDEKPVYGVSTGFGHLQSTWIPLDQQNTLQKNLVRSHASGTGEVVPAGITRTAMILLANSLAKGHSGIRIETFKLLVSMINNDLIPVTYTIGSLGASGDLAPLAHVALTLMGEGEISENDKISNSRDILEKHNLEPITLRSKEGLALINGTHFVTAYALHILHQAKNIIDHSLISAALSIEALKGTDKPFDPQIGSIRQHPGHQIIAKAMKHLLKDSEIIESHRDPKSDHKTQDAYALRCIPQVLGAIWDAFTYFSNTVQVEINAVTDNPLIFPATGEIISGGNFHAEPLGIPLEAISLGLIELANITEARISRLVSPFTSELPAFLAHKPGLESGYMIAHYMVAALLNRIRTLASPSLSDNIPVSGNQEDHVSMAMNSAVKAFEITSIVEEIVASELLMAIRGLNLVNRPSTSPILEKVITFVNSKVEFTREDHVIRDRIQSMKKLVHDGEIVKMVKNNLEQFTPEIF